MPVLSIEGMTLVLFVVGFPLIMGIKFLQKKDTLIKISGLLLIGCSIYFALNLISVN